MWLAKSEVADLYLSGGTLAIRAQGNVTLHPLAKDWRSSVQAGLAEWPKRGWRIWLGGRRCGLHLCEPIAGVRSIEEAETALSATLSLDGRAVSVRLATWAAQGRWLALATDVGLIESLMSVVEEAAGQVRSVRPWWTAAGGDLACAAMCDDEAVTYWRTDERGLISSAATMLTGEHQQFAALQRLRIGGAITAWRLTLDAPAGRVEGFAARSLNEDADVAARPSV